MTLMLPPDRESSVWSTTRRIRIVARGCTVLWAVTLAGFGICVAARSSNEMQSAVGVVSNGFLALGYALQAIAHRAEQRAMDFADAQRRELVSATSRRR